MTIMLMNKFLPNFFTLMQMIIVVLFLSCIPSSLTSHGLTQESQLAADNLMSWPHGVFGSFCRVQPLIGKEIR